MTTVTSMTPMTPMTGSSGAARMHLASRRSPAAFRPTMSAVALAALLALSAAPNAANAVTYTWSGAGGNLFSTNGSWQGNAAPPLSGLTTSDLIFGTSSVLSPNINGAYSIRSLTFAAGAGAYTFTGSPLTLGPGGLAQNAASAQTFTAQVVLGADQTWTLASGAGALNLNNGLNTTSGGVDRALTISAATAAGNGNVVSGVISGGGSLTKTGGGILTLTGASTYTGGTTVSAGTLAIASGASLTGKLVVNVGATLAISGNVNSGSRQGALLDGTVNLNSTGTLSTGPVVIGFAGSGSFNQTGGSFTTNGAAMNVGFADTGTGTYNLSDGSLTTGATIVGRSAGNNVFTQSGGVHTTGTLVMAAGGTSNRGTYNLNGGTLAADAISNNAGGDRVTGTSTFNFNGGFLGATASNANFMEGLTTASVQAGGAKLDTGGFDITIAQPLLHDAALGSTIDGGLSKSNAGTLTLTGANTYTGNTTVRFGTLAIGGGGSINTPTRALQVAAGANTVASVTLSGNASSLSTADAYVGYDGRGTFTQSGGSFTTNGNTLFLGLKPTSSGTYELSGGNLTTGQTQVSDDANTSLFTQSGGTHTTGTLRLTGSGFLSKGTYNLNGGTLIAGSITSGDNGVSGNSTFNFNGGTLQASTNSPSFMAGLTRANVQTGGAVINTAGFNVTVAQALVHDASPGMAPVDGGLTKLGAGTLTLTSANAFTGAVTIAAGTLAVAGEANLGSGNMVTVNGSGALLFTGNATLSRTYNLGVSTLALGGSGNTLTLGSGAVVNGGFLSGPGTAVLGNNATLNNVTSFANSTFTQAGGAATVNGSTIRGALTQTGGTLAANNVFVSGSGRLAVGGTLNTTGTEVQGVTTINAGGVLANSGSSLYLSGGSRTTVNGGGTLSTAAGTTIELNGSQLVNNGAQTGVLNVNYGSLAKGSGSFGTVNVGDGGRFSPGNSPGTATASSFSFGAGGRYDFELTSANPSAGTQSDLLVVSDTLLIAAGSTPNSVFTIGINSLNQANQPAALGNFDSSLSYHFLLVDAGSVSGFAASRFNVDTSSFLDSLNGGSFSVSLNGSDLYLDFNPAAVPEPATWAMWLAAAAMGVGLRARQQRKPRG